MEVDIILLPKSKSNWFLFRLCFDSYTYTNKLGPFLTTKLTCAEVNLQIKWRYMIRRLDYIRARKRFGYLHLIKERLLALLKRMELDSQLLTTRY